VNSVFYMAVLGGSALGALLGGVVARIIGVGRTFQVAGLAGLVLAAVMWRYLAAANLRESEASEDSARADPAEMLEGD
jgi:uncharacterized protein YcfJ